MSEFYVRAVKVGPIAKHPGADNLSITQIDATNGNEGYPVIIKTGDFTEGHLAAYIPVDSIVPDTETWTFLKGHRRIKARRLRGIFSMGLLCPLPPGDWKEGDNLQEALGITKYEPEVEHDIPNDPWTGPKLKGWGPIYWLKKLYYYWKFGRSKLTGTPKFVFPEYTDIEGLRKWSKVLQEGEEVTLSEKIHGSNARFAFHNRKFWVGSHHQFKGRPRAGVADNFWQAAFNANLETKLAKSPGIAFYGEVYGKVQKGFPYDKPGDVKVRFFDARDLKTLRYLDYPDFLKLCDRLDLEVVPEIFRGPWSESLKYLAEGSSTLAKHIREGFVVRPIKERHDSRLGRVILKMVGEGYLTSKDS
jgi:tRNA-binding EMAP/Myf-like protein